MLRVFTTEGDRSYWILRRVGTHFLSLGAPRHVAGFHLVPLGQLALYIELWTQKRFPRPQLR